MKKKESIFTMQSKFTNLIDGLMFFLLHSRFLPKWSSINPLGFCLAKKMNICLISQFVCHNLFFPSLYDHGAEWSVVFNFTFFLPTWTGLEKKWHSIIIQRVFFLPFENISWSIIKNFTWQKTEHLGTRYFLSQSSKNSSVNHIHINHVHISKCANSIKRKEFPKKRIDQSFLGIKFFGQTPLVLVSINDNFKEKFSNLKVFFKSPTQAQRQARNFPNRLSMYHAG